MPRLYRSSTTGSEGVREGGRAAPALLHNITVAASKSHSTRPIATARRRVWVHPAYESCEHRWSCDDGGPTQDPRTADLAWGNPNDWFSGPVKLFLPGGRVGEALRSNYSLTISRCCVVHRALQTTRPVFDSLTGNPDLRPCPPRIVPAYRRRHLLPLLPTYYLGTQLSLLSD